MRRSKRKVLHCRPRPGAGPAYLVRWTRSPGRGERRRPAASSSPWWTCGVRSETRSTATRLRSGSFSTSSTPCAISARPSTRSGAASTDSPARTAPSSRDNGTPCSPTGRTSPATAATARGAPESHLPPVQGAGGLHRAEHLQRRAGGQSSRGSGRRSIAYALSLAVFSAAFRRRFLFPAARSSIRAVSAAWSSIQPSLSQVPPAGAGAPSCRASGDSNDSKAGRSSISGRTPPAWTGMMGATQMGGRSNDFVPIHNSASDMRFFL